MKSSTILLVFFSLLSTSLSYRNREVFKQNIDVESCLGRLPGSQGSYGANGFEPVGYTLESFISLMEKIEYHHPDMDIFELTQMILERFYFPNTYFTLVGPRRSPTVKKEAQHREELLLKLLPRSPEELAPKFRENELTDNEKCSLYFMLSHNINDTFRKGVDDALQPNEQPTNSEQGQPIDGNARVEYAQRPREEGVVSLHSDPVSAVAMGKILVGIAAGEYKDYKKKLIDVGIDDEPNKEREFDVLTALTLGDAIAAAEFSLEKISNNGLSDRSKYGPPGEWNSARCPSEYKLLSNKTSTTDAELRGSIDGYILGVYVKELRDEISHQLKLSRLIRAYYGRSKLIIGTNMVNFCDRSNNVQHDQDSIFATAETVFVYLSLKASFGRPDEHVLAEFKRSFVSYTDYVAKLMDRKNGKRGYHEEYNICNLPKGESNVIDYDTPLDLFVVLDVSEYNTRGWKEQIEVIGHLAGHLDIGNGAGSVTVLLNSRSGLQMDIKNETNSACATCKMARMDLRSAERDNIASVLELLNRTIKDYKEQRRYEPAVPAKAVIFFHYGQLNEDIKRLEDASRILRDGHRDADVYAIGTDDDALGKIATSQGQKISGTRQTPVDLANRIREEIRRLPGSLQYHECGKPRSKVEDENIFHGYVTPKTKQMWAMFPDYFLKSYTIEFRFKTDTSNGKIKVCYQRNNFDPSLNPQSHCQETGVNGASEVIFKISNPCHGYNRENCYAINFSVEGLVRDIVGGSRPACDAANCRRTDQIKFTVSHKGVACSDALGLLPSKMLLLAIFYAVLRNL